jgi:hypothetical protein
MRTSAARAALVAGIAVVAITCPTDGIAQITRAPLARCRERSSVAVAPDGTVHVIYQSPNYHCRHRWGRPGAWKDEIVDPQSEGGWWSSVAVDSLGRVHAAFNANRPAIGGGGVLAYGLRDASGWTVTDLGPGGLATSIAIGPDDRPRILAVDDSLAAQFAEFDGSQWTVTNTGLAADGNQSTSLVIDAAGKAHATVGTNTQIAYATNESGTWVSVPLETGGAAASVALDAQGHPHVAAAYDSGVPVHVLRHLWNDGSGWQGETITVPGMPANYTLTVDDTALQADAAGHLFLLASYGVRSPRGEGEVTLLAHWDRAIWRFGLVQPHAAGHYVSMARGADGSLHTTCRALGSGRGLYARVAFSDLAAALEDVRTEPSGAKTLVHATLRVSNDGAARSKPVTVGYFASSDDLLDTNDELVGAAKVGAVAPGTSVTIPVALKVPTPPPGTRLLAVLDALQRHDDLDRPNNTASAVIAQ